MDAATASPITARRHHGYTIPGLVGAVLAGAVFLVVLCNGHLSLLQTPAAASDFYDVQAHSLLDGRWDVPRASLAVEGFLIDGKVYTYFGPLPALLRLPIAAVTDRFDGRLGQISMLVAFALALTFTVRLAGRLRPLVRGSAPVTRGEQWAVGAFTFLIGAGSVLVFLASRSWVYHEATLWGLALTLAAFEFVIAYALAPTRRHLVLASALTSAALLSRASVGLGPLVALGLLFAASGWPATRRLAGMADQDRGRSVRLSLGAAALVPLALYAYVNYSKFGTLFSLPFKDQFLSDLYPIHRKALAANGGSMMSTKVVPTTVVQYLRPDTLQFSGLFPWVTFAGQSITIGNTVTEWSWSASYTATMPALTVLGVVGVVALLRPPPGRSSLAALRAPVIGAAAAGLTTLASVYLAHRYLSDFMPLGLLAALIGLHVVLRWTSAAERRLPTRTAWTGLALLAAVSVWFNVGLAVMYGRVLEENVDQHDRASFVAFQYRLHDKLPGGPPPSVATGSRFPPLKQGALYVLGRCDALYWSDSYKWRVLERGERRGHYRLRVRFPTAPTGWEPLVVSRHGGRPQQLAARVLPGDRVQFAYDTTAVGRPVPIRPGHRHDVEILIDPMDPRAAAKTVRLTVDGRPAVSHRLQPAGGKRLSSSTGPIGERSAATTGDRFTGTISHRPPPLCHRVSPARR